MFGLGATELVVIGVIVLFIFGAKRLPEIGKGLGGAVREFKQVKKDLAPDKPSAQRPLQDTDPQDPEQTPTLEEKLGQKVLGQIPGVRRARQVKNKVDKVKDLMNT